MSMRPNASTVDWTRRWMMSARLTSPTKVRARRPAPRICSAVLSTSRQPIFFSSSGYVAGSRPVPVTTTSAPSLARASAVARPMPRSRPAPVTSATLPSSEPMFSPLVSARTANLLADVAEFPVPRGNAIFHVLGPRLCSVRAERLTMRDGQHVVLERRLDRAAMALNVHRLVHGRLRELERVGILKRDALRQLQGGFGQLLARDHAVDQAQIAGRPRIDVVAGAEILLRFPRAQIPRHREVLHVGAAPAHGAVREKRVLGGYNQVAAGREHETAHDAVALHLGDGGLRHVTPAETGLDIEIREALEVLRDAGAHGMRPLVLS